MLIARLLTRLREMKTLHVFVLEILAVFIGITASLFIDDWRQERQDVETLDRILQDIHYGALQARTSHRGEFIFNARALESAIALVYGDVENIPDSEVVAHFLTMMVRPGRMEVVTGHSRLSSTSLSIPFDRIMAELDGAFAPLKRATGDYNTIRETVNRLIDDMFSHTGLIEGPENWTSDALTVESGRQQRALQELVFGNDGILEDVDNVGAVRLALDDPEFVSLIKDSINQRVDLGLTTNELDSFTESVIITIRSHAPDVSLPIDSVGIDGTGTGAGFSVPDLLNMPSLSLPMVQSSGDPNVWELVLDLVDGEVKFRADDNWVTNWGAPQTSRNLSLARDYSFSGDPTTVFPRGTAMMGGLNIPVKAGRYTVTFNSQTFEYSFERVDSGGETNDGN